MIRALAAASLASPDAETLARASIALLLVIVGRAGFALWWVTR